MLAVDPEVVLVVGDGAPPGVRFGAGTAATCAASASTPTSLSTGTCEPADDGCPWRTPWGPGCWTRRPSSGRGWVWVRPTSSSSCGTSPAPWGSSPWGTDRRGAGQGTGLPRRPAGPFDAAVARALATGDAGALAALDLGAGERLLAAACPPGGRWGPRSPAASHRPAALRRRAVRRRLPRRRLGRRVSALPPVVAVVGPTATGKSALAVELAHGSAARWSTPTRCSSTAAWTSAPPSPTAERGGVPHHLLDLWHVREAARSRSTGRPPARRSTGCARRACSRCWWAAPGSTCAPSSTSSTSPAPTPRSVPGWRPSWPPSAPPRCTPGWPGWTPPPRRRSCPATDAGSCARSRSSS